MTDKTEAMDNLIAQDADLIEICPDQEQGQYDARYLRAKLEARGLEIREKGQ